MFLRVFGWFVAHHMRDVVPDTEEQGSVRPLEEAVGDGDVRPCFAGCFYKVWLERNADPFSADT